MTSPHPSSTSSQPHRSRTVSALPLPTSDIHRVRSGRISRSRSASSTLTQSGLHSHPQYLEAAVSGPERYRLPAARLPVLEESLPLFEEQPGQPLGSIGRPPYVASPAPLSLHPETALGYQHLPQPSPQETQLHPRAEIQDMSALGLLLPSSLGGPFDNFQSGFDTSGYNMDQRSSAQQYYAQPSPHLPGYAHSYAASPGVLSSSPLPHQSRRRASSERGPGAGYEPSPAPMRSPYQQPPTTFQASLPSVDYTSVSPETPAFTSSSSQSSPFPTHSPLVSGAGSLGYSPGFAGPSAYGASSYETGGYGQMPGSSQVYLPQPSPYQASYPTTSPAERAALSAAAQGNVRVLNSRPKPQCWEHGCNGRQFSTFSNLLRHQREKSGTAAKSYCPKCGAEFTRTTARNGHILHDKCKRKSVSEADAAQSMGASSGAITTSK